MSVRRQLLTHDSTTVDFRVGVGAIDEFNRMVRYVMGQTRRALIVHGVDVSADVLDTICEELRDLEIEPSVAVTSAIDGPIAALERADFVFDSLAAGDITVDDMIIGFGDTAVCSLVSYCAGVWCGGTQALLLPTTLHAMATAATSMRPLDTSRAAEMVFLQPTPALVACDLSYVTGAPPSRLLAGHIALLRSSIFGSRMSWERFGEQIPAILGGDETAIAEELVSAQSSRLSVIKASNPSARHARSYGVTCARALRHCLGAGAGACVLLAEGMRFEARLAHEAAGLDIDEVFEQDDRLEDLGAHELRLDLDETAFMEALATTSGRFSNRFLFALPRNPGTIRLTAIDTDVLRRHVRAFLKSRSGGALEDYLALNTAVE